MVNRVDGHRHRLFAGCRRPIRLSEESALMLAAALALDPGKRPRAAGVFVLPLIEVWD
jgi:hypothetical protein